jgi:hypothetical protein
VLEDLPDDRRTPVCRVGTGRLNHGNDFHGSAAMGTEQRIDLVDLTNQARPSRLSSTQARSADLQGRPGNRAGDWVRRFGFREEPVPLAVASHLSSFVAGCAS